jgi:hypothetical protein
MCCASASHHKMSDWFLEQQINIRLCVKLGKNASHKFSMITRAYWGEGMKKSSVFKGYKWFKECLHVKFTDEENAHHLLQYQEYVHFEIIPQGQIVNQAYYVEIQKWLCEVVHIKMHELWPSDWILCHDDAPAHKVLSFKQFLAQKSITEMEHPSCSLIWL